MNKSEKFDVLSYMRSITPPKPKDLNDYTVTKWCDYWLRVCCNGVKTTTYRSYESIIEHHIKPVLGDVLLQELTYEDVQLFINSMKMGVGIEAPLSPKTIKTFMECFTKLCQQQKSIVISNLTLLIRLFFHQFHIMKFMYCLFQKSEHS